jgi:hypothetical protein
MEAAAFTGFLIFICFVGGFVSGFLAGKVAHAKGWSGFAWGMAGFLFGPLGLIAAAGLPDRRLRQYLRELSMHQGVSLEALEKESDSFDQSSFAESGNADFTTSKYATDEDIWDYLWAVMPQEIRDCADKGASDLRGNQGRIIVRGANGNYLCEANEVQTSKDGLTSWKVSRRVRFT